MGFSREFKVFLSDQRKVSVIKRRPHYRDVHCEKVDCVMLVHPSICMEMHGDAWRCIEISVLSLK